MSSINTNSLDVNYPIPGQNNSTQGFRNNFTNIKQNLDIAGNEITDLQNKAVLKSALANSTINNDMANTLIANASTLQFRATTYNLGNALTGNVQMDCSIADVQYGNVSGNITLNFSNWIPTNTKGGVELHIGRPNANVNYSILFPSECIFDGNYGWNLLENSNYSNNISTITFPNDVTQINLNLTSTDCGNTIFVEPINRPFKATQIQQGTPPSTGRLGDTNGTIYISSSNPQLMTTITYANDYIQTSNTSSLYVGMPVIFTAGSSGVSIEGNITLGTTYYVSNIATGGTLFKISANANTSGNVDLSGNTGNMYLNPVSYLYVAAADFSANSYNRSIDSTTGPNIITVSGITANLVPNYPIIFTTTDVTGNLAGLSIDTPYYIKTVSGPNITISKTRSNGVAGPEYQGITTVTSGNVDADYTVYDGPDIFRRIPLQPF